ncbi:hypothetical protein [Dactylosporangium sp. NPDC005555]|uniref:hypothetical protein n=1 Tax=Dactylosporangium sp. NPDC005555 TaxID=3154889 RepID=UPI0033AAEDD5
MRPVSITTRTADRPVSITTRTADRPVSITTRTADRPVTSPPPPPPGERPGPPPPPSGKAGPPPPPSGKAGPPPPASGQADAAPAADAKPKPRWGGKPAPGEEVTYVDELKTKQSQPAVVNPRKVMRQRLGEVDRLLKWHDALLLKVASGDEIARIRRLAGEALAALDASKDEPDEYLIQTVTDATASMKMIGMRPLPETDDFDIEVAGQRNAQRRAAEAAAEAERRAAEARGEPLPQDDEDAEDPPSFKQQVESMLVHVPNAPQLSASVDWARRLIAEQKYFTASYVIEHVYLVGSRMAAAAKDAERDNKQRREDLRKPGMVGAAVADLSNGQFDSVRTAVKGLKDDTLLTAAEGHPKLKDLIDRVFGSPAVATRAAEAPDVFADLILGAIKLSRVSEGRKTVKVTEADVAQLRGALGPDAARAVATHLLVHNWQGGKAFDENTMTWVLKNIDLEAWNKPKQGLAARAYNMLWHAGRFGDMIALIDRGVSPRLPATTGSDNGRNREGVWSGYIQPLEHLLGNYVRLADPEVMDREVTNPEERRKVLGAAALLKTLAGRGDTTIVTTWKEVKSCQAIIGFADHPGTIWGFEDVRLPYVQAAHETEKGAQPVRMMEIWDAVEKALDATGYPALLADPDTVIAKCIDIGLAKLKTGIAEKPREYYKRDSPEFEQRFREQAESYLRFLAKQTPTAKLAVADLSGKRPDKWMGALGCKAGLWWAASKGEPVYYVLDGLNERDAIDYKAYKTKKINKRMAEPLKFQAFGEVITLSEIREILKHWDDTDDAGKRLRDVVKMVERGNVLEGEKLEKVDEWAREMRAADLATKERLKRTPPSKAALAPKLKGLDTNPDLMSLDERVLKDVVLQADLVKMAAGAHHELLSGALRNCKALYSSLLLPEDFAVAYTAMLELPLGKRAVAADELKLAYLNEGQVATALLEPLRTAVDRWAVTEIR